MAQLGYIYKIFSECDNYDENLTYYGSTRKSLNSRYNVHRYNYLRGIQGTSVKKLFDTYGIENCKMVLVEEVAFENKEDLYQREAYYILNCPCLNKNIPYMTVEERKKMAANYFRDYYAANPEYRKRKLARMREYAEIKKGSLPVI